jgi:hypothetical protein
MSEDVFIDMLEDDEQPSDEGLDEAPCSVAFGDLFEGDRFRFDGNLYTRIDGSYARRHSDASVELGHRGYGYRDSLCTFAPSMKVEFCPPNTQDRSRPSLATKTPSTD